MKLIKHYNGFLQKNMIILATLAVLFFSFFISFSLFKGPGLPADLVKVQDALDKQDVSISGGLVRREHANVEYKALLSTRSHGTKLYFFVEKCSSVDAAKYRLSEVSVAPSRKFIAGTMVVYFPDTWSGENSLTETIKAAFLATNQ